MPSDLPGILEPTTRRWPPGCIGASTARPSRLARWAMGAVDFLRGIIRPGATIYGYVLLTYLLIWVQQLYAEKALQLSPEQAAKLAAEVIGTVTYLATTCATWWFGVRANSGRK